MAHIRIVGSEDQIRRLVSLLPKAKRQLNRADPNMCRFYIEVDNRILDEWINAHEENSAARDQLNELLEPVEA